MQCYLKVKRNPAGKQIPLYNFLINMKGTVAILLLTLETFIMYEQKVYREC